MRWRPLQWHATELAERKYKWGNIKWDGAFSYRPGLARHGAVRCKHFVRQ
ncbi:hypothetical protein BLA3211_02562 [Burkholderia aenigmatica]|uniref:Uncharacterized protein n=1 Tax=Burkholderia aenigmatica TaxID=2015348 RepID=A0A6J5IY91_9BURK|nr:hypothetical protein BLA3211_02562 [Burkholderia aenigmatica]